MKWLFAFILAISLCFQAMAYESGPVEHQWWLDTFGTEISLDSPFDHLDQLILPKDSTCGSQTQNLLQAIRQYAELASKGHGAKAKNQANQILKIVQGTKECSQELLNTYLLGSYFISQRDLIHQSVGWMNDPKFYSQIPIRNVLMAAMLIHDGKVVFLTPDERKTLGGEWESPQIYGSYDCVSRTIFIDPSARPFDLGSSFEHEMDHLLRDQYFGADLIEKYFSSSGKAEDVDWEAFLTLDESLASIEAAVLQRSQSTQNRVVTVSTSGFLGFGKMGPFRSSLLGSYKADQDFTFRNSSGPMERLFQAGDLTNPADDITYQNSDLNGDPFANHPPDQYFGIFDVVHRVYFNGTPLPLSLVTILSHSQPKKIESLTSGVTLPVLYEVLGAYNIAPNQLVSEIQEELQGKTPASNHIPLIIAEVQQLRTSLQTESSACTLYGDAVSSGKVQGYIGLEYSTEGKDKSIQPGEGGSRPGEGGSRPGEAGSRPSLSVRPCLSMDKKL